MKKHEELKRREKWRRKEKKQEKIQSNLLVKMGPKDIAAGKTHTHKKGTKNSRIKQTNEANYAAGKEKGTTKHHW